MTGDNPTDPKSWLARAESNLRLAEHGGEIAGVSFEDLCFNAQQAAEKALKAVCLSAGIEFPKTHSLVRLMDMLEEKNQKIPESVRSADALTQYAVQSRYPGFDEAIPPEEYIEAVGLARCVVQWADSIVDK